MKKIIAGIMTGVMCIGLFGCSNKKIAEKPKIDIIDALEFKNGETKFLRMNSMNKNLKTHYLIYGFTDDSKIISEILSDYSMYSISNLHNEEFKGFVLLKRHVVYLTRDTNVPKKLADDFYILAPFFDSPSGAGFYDSFKAINCLDHEIVLNTTIEPDVPDFGNCFVVKEEDLIDAGILVKTPTTNFSIS